MKMLTLTQPWATLVVRGLKRIETRSWHTAYRGALGIHAAKAFPGWAKDLCQARMFCRAMGWPECPAVLTQEWLDDNAARIKALPTGAVLGAVDMVNCLDVATIEKYVAPFNEQERAFGNYDAGRFGFLFENPAELPAPVRAKGALSLWDWEPPTDVAGFLQDRAKRSTASRRTGAGR